MIELCCREIGPEGGHAAGRQLLADMVLAHTGSALPPVAVTSRGKPYFPDSPIHFSISHSKHHVFCALSDRPIGVDAEEVDRELSLALAERILSAGEYALWQSAPDPRLALLTFWVLKEAQAKATGDGLRGYPNQTNFSLEDPRVTLHSGCLVAVIEEDDHAL